MITNIEDNGDYITLVIDGDTAAGMSLMDLLNDYYNGGGK